MLDSIKSRLEAAQQQCAVEIACRPHTSRIPLEFLTEDVPALIAENERLQGEKAGFHVTLSEDAAQLIRDGYRLGGYFYHGNFVWTVGRPHSWTFYGNTPEEAFEEAIRGIAKREEWTP